MKAVINYYVNLQRFAVFTLTTNVSLECGGT